MDNFRVDQAEGLRRLLGGHQQRIYTFSSTLPSEQKNQVLFNLAASLSRSGSSVMLLDATCSRDGVSHYHPKEYACATLADVVRNERTIEDVYYHVPQGFDLVCMANHAGEIKNASFLSWLDASFESAAEEADVVLIDSRLGQRNNFPLSAMESSSQILLVEDTEKSIKSAYVLIKRMTSHFGRISFGVLVSGNGESRSQTVFQNMAQTASQYLGVQLYFMGYVPKDEHMDKAASLGRSVVDAFPMALSSFAFRKIANTFSDMGASQNMFEMVGA